MRAWVLVAILITAGCIGQTGAQTQQAHSLSPCGSDTAGDVLVNRGSPPVGALDIVRVCARYENGELIASLQTKQYISPDVQYLVVVDTDKTAMAFVKGPGNYSSVVCNDLAMDKNYTKGRDCTDFMKVNVSGPDIVFSLPSEVFKYPEPAYLEVRAKTSYKPSSYFFYNLGPSEADASDQAPDKFGMKFG